jgi:phenylacetate-CoA ligase
MDIKKKLNSLKRKRTIRYLQTTKPEYFEDLSEKKLLSEFNKINSSFPAYMSILEERRIIPRSVKAIDDFKLRVPVLKKSDYFEKYTFNQLLGSNVSKARVITSSSGFSGTFAYGFASDTAVKNSRSGVDLTLDYWFDISNRKTFLINSAPMGVHIETSLALAETSVRSDMVLSLLQKISPTFDQTIIVGDPHFLKKLIEEGTQKKIQWKDLGISLVTGQDWLPESLRTYLSKLLDIDIDTDNNRAIYATMGMTELGLNVFHESKYTVRLRRKVLNDPVLKQKLMIHEIKAPPMFFHYYPFRTYIESLDSAEGRDLLFTVLDKNTLLPIFRYSTGDSGFTISYRDLHEILNEDYPHLLPDLKLPLGLMLGRTKNRFATNGECFSLEDIKEGLYSDFDVADSITGLFNVNNDHNKIGITIQLKKDRYPDKILEQKIFNALHTYIDAEIVIKALKYFEFPEGTELNYERKLYTR